MNTQNMTTELEQALNDLPILDSHTHLTAGKLSARGLHDILLYHMVVSDLYSAGCPNGARLTEYPGWPTEKEAHARIEEALPFLPHIRNTSCFWGLQTLLADLYGWDNPITKDNWKKLDAMIRERADDQAWQRQVMREAKIEKFVTEWARREGGQDSDILQYSMEWAFFTRTQRDEFDTAIYELERCWGRKPESPIPHAAAKRLTPDREIRTLDDIHAAMAHYVRELAETPVLSMATHISTEIVFRKVTDQEMAAALARRDSAGPEERDLYASYIHEAFLTALKPYADKIVFQFSFAAEPMPHETASIIPQRAITHVADIAARHPKIKFLCFVASRHANQSLCTLGRELPNFSLAGYWWHNFFPDAIRQVIGERLDMVALNKQIGFFSDAYCLEWAYAKTRIVKKQLAAVLAEKIRQGQYSIIEAVNIARAILYDTPQSLLRMTP
jgi:hypothetical protein